MVGPICSAPARICTHLCVSSAVPVPAFGCARDETVEMVLCARAASNRVVFCVGSLTGVINGPCLIVISRIGDDHSPDPLKPLAFRPTYHRRGPALGGPGCCNFAFSTTRAPVRLFLPSKLSHPLIYEWVGPNRGAEGVKHTLSSLGSAPQAQEGPTPRPRMRPRCSHSEADRTACSQAVRPAVAFACGIRSSRWLRCFSQSPVARGRRAR